MATDWIGYRKWPCKCMGNGWLEGVLLEYLT